ncbi:MAG: phosphatase PAP2 family protein [Ilumatobacteraceae bacterium]
MFIWSAKYFGLPVDRVAIVSWILAAFVCSNIGKPLPDQWRMLKDWSFFALLLFAYDYSRGMADQLGRSVDFTVIRNIDRALFLGHDPNVWIQQHLNISSDLAWYEYPLAVTYMTHFIVPISVAVVLWIRNRAEWLRYMRRLGILLATGVVTYVIFPVAPPWMAARNGFIAPIRRITARAWSHMGLSTVSKLFERGAAITNPVAALPSLHAAFSLLVVAFFWQQMPKWCRAVSLLLPASMALCLVYFGEHWVTDIVLGWLYVWIVLWVANRWERAPRHAVSAESPTI